MSDKFDWNEVEDRIAVEEQRRTAVYLNPVGSVVIRQAGDVYDDDSVIVILPQSVPDLIEALRSAVEGGL